MERTLWRSKVAGREDFAQLLEQHGEALIRYCRFLTGSAPDAEDLLQETWLKAWSVFRDRQQAWNRTYLRSIAYHTWIDRKRKSQHEALPDIRTENETAEAFEPLRLWSAVETLLRILTPDQRTAYLLMEYMRFTAAETAELMQTTEGGVKASLHRARRKLDSYRKKEQDQRHGTLGEKSEAERQDEQTVYAYMEAIRLQEVRALLILWNGGSGEDAALAVRCANAERPVRGTDAARKTRMSLARADGRLPFSPLCLHQAA